MGAYKQFNSQDIIISPFEVNKGFTFKGNAALTASNVEIDRFFGRPGNYLISQSLSGKISGSEIPEVLLYNSVKQLYYSNYISGSDGQISIANTASFNTDGTVTGPIYQTSFYNYEETDLNPQKNFPTASDSLIGVISIPSKLYGDYIQPESIKIESPLSGTILDDGEGRLYITALDADFYIGNVIYQHGLISLTQYPETGSYTRDGFLNAFISASEVTCSFSSSYEIYETQYKCTIGSDEFNYSLNPTVLSGSKGDLYPYFTGSYFDPYVTTIGLYNDKFELLGIGKLAKPLPTSRTTDTTILINIDR